MRSERVLRPYVADATNGFGVVLFGRPWQEGAGLVLPPVVIMAQHFLLSAAARSLSAAKIMRMSDRGVENVFRRLRWPDTDGRLVPRVIDYAENFRIDGSAPQ